MKSCAAIDCKRTIPQSVLFCQEHQWMIPHDLKRKLLRRQGPDQFKVALKQAIGVIAYKEGKAMPEK